MAAAYETGTATSPGDLLGLWTVWLEAQGWTINLYTGDGSGGRSHLNRAGRFLHMRVAVGEQLWPKATSGFHDQGVSGGHGIGLYLGTGFDGGQPWHLQPGRPTRTDGSTNGCGASFQSGPIASYHFFDDGFDNVIAVVERSPGVFCHFGLGHYLVPVGNSENYWYFFGSSSAYRNTAQGSPGRTGIDITAACPMAHADEDPASDGGNFGDFVHSNAFVRVDATTWPDRWVGNGGNNISGGIGYGYTGRYLRCALNTGIETDSVLQSSEYPSYQFFRDRVHQSAFAGALLLPLHGFVETIDARWAPVGYPANISYSTAVGHGYGAGDIFQVGGLDYMLFPNFAVRKAA